MLKTILRLFILPDGGDFAAMLPDHNLSPRKKMILKAIIDAHIDAGEPVGSKYLTQYKQLSYSSATIRNEMAELEALGYLEHPYTSAGRVPSDLGYRFYVDALLQKYSMTAQEISELNQLMHTKMTELDKLLERATKIASSMTNYTGLSMKPRPRSATIERFETIPLDESSFVLVMLTNVNSVKTKYIKLGFGCPKEEIVKLGSVLTECISGITADEITLPKIMDIEARMGIYCYIVNPAIKSIYEVISEIDNGDVKVAGANLLLQYPEYSDITKLKDMLNLFEKKDELLDIVSQADENDVNVFIGSETSVNTMNNSAFIFKTIKSAGRTVGAIGIIGPCRMNYSRVITTVNQLSSTISDIINGNDLIGEAGDIKIQGDN